jgi:hypothetical protein
VFVVFVQLDFQAIFLDLLIKQITVITLCSLLGLISKSVCAVNKYSKSCTLCLIENLNQNLFDAQKLQLKNENRFLNLIPKLYSYNSMQTHTNYSTYRQLPINATLKKENAAHRIQPCAGCSELFPRNKADFWNIHCHNCYRLAQREQKQQDPIDIEQSDKKQKFPIVSYSDDDVDVAK